ncbi:DNA-methyltransferase [Leptospira santarosai]|uniref:Methyltransferase n=1 Tax=Leptospira santarosai serovar Arenal str. MAVJ 401 TaxID=1049976 RepID=M6JT59_9LEPT|nr:site-specific DNA-methyltransferase [Leptospira santarosai]EMN22818.1 DNA methylase family protein [Leptospira santarosai serovar Arenal str. MAVJ 401]
MKTFHKTHIGDTKELLKTFPKEFVHLSITSPPYWNIKDYEDQRQIGFGESYDEYLKSLNVVWKETKRVLLPGCKMIINVGDQFRRASENNGKYEIIPIHSDIIRNCQKLGFIFLGNIIWRKITSTKTSGGGSWMGSIYHPRDGYITYEHEYIILFKKSGKPPKVTESQKELSKLPKEFRSKWFRGIWDDIHGERQNVHKAKFPLEIPERLIRMFSFSGETILDPFMGSGTTAEAAFLNNRNSVGIELNTRYANLGKKRVESMEIISENVHNYGKRSA